MCCLFGLLDYQQTLKKKKRSQIVRGLSIASQARGVDATGLAWFQQGRLEIQKAPFPAAQFSFHLSSDASFVMGHTRMTTQGSADKNYNNHPFAGKTNGSSFAFAHNGILHNDLELRAEHHLPNTKIETDSYVTVQLLERQPLSMAGIASVAEKLEGTFTFTVLDSSGMYLVKGNNPLCILDFYTRGFYLYASTELVMEHALKQLHMNQIPHKEISIEQGEILHIGVDGQITRGSFNDRNLRTSYGWFLPSYMERDFLEDEDEHMEQILSCARDLNVPSAEMKMLADAGYDALDLEELLYDPELRRCCIDELLCDWGYC